MTCILCLWPSFTRISAQGLIGTTLYDMFGVGYCLLLEHRFLLIACIYTYYYKKTLDRLGKRPFVPQGKLRCFQFGEERVPLLLSQARDHLVLCLFPIGKRSCQCLAATFSQPHQVPAPVRPCLNREEPEALERLQVARERRTVHDQCLSQLRHGCFTQQCNGDQQSELG